MTLGTLVLAVAVIALVITAAMGLLTDKIKSWVVSYLQNFCGVLFIVSGWVKAMDPLGTAYKMEQYFAEFEGTFEDTAMSFMAPLFPQLAEFSITFAVGMIIFEIVLGVMLIIGAYRGFTKWAFFLLVAFFTFLTGFTYMTGYVPEGVNFFQFGQWGPYVETNMKVTDCGCFGDFIKLKPKTSFIKDVVLLIPAIIFLFSGSVMHQFFSKIMRLGITAGVTAGIFLYCVSNFYWDLPHTDFRPFKEGANIAAAKAEQEEAINNITVTAYEVTERESGRTQVIPYKQYLKEYKNYPDSIYDKEQLRSEPEVTINKISEFDLTDVDGYSQSEAVLSEAGFSFMLVAYKLKGKSKAITQTVYDTIFNYDTLLVDGVQQIDRTVAESVSREITTYDYDWDLDYLDLWKKTNPVMQSALQNGLKVYGVSGPADESTLTSFQKAIGMSYPMYTADDILLKTIIRSNPGIVLWHNGTIVKKWHISKFPEDFGKIKEQYNIE